MKTIVIYSSDEFVRQALFQSVNGLAGETFHYEGLGELDVHLESLVPDIIILDLKNLIMQESEVISLKNCPSKLYLLYEENCDAHKSLVTEASYSMKYPVDLLALKKQLRALEEDK